MKKFFLMLLAIVGLTMQANAITLTVVSGDKNDPNNNEGCQKLVDGNFGTKWGDGISEGQSKYVVLKANVAITPASYVLVTGNDTGGSPGRNWNVWKVYAGNFASDADAARDAEGWVLIDQRADVAGTDQLPAADSQATPPFVLTETVTGSYLYYKIEIEACKDLNTYMQMGEFYFDSYKVDLSAFADDITAANNFDYKKADDALLEAEYESLLAQLNAAEDADTVDALLTKISTLKNFIDTQAEKQFYALSGNNTWGDGGWSNFVDGNYDTKWGGGLGSGMWIVFRVRGGVQPYVYRLVTGADTKSYWDRNWSTWTVYGANFKSISEVSENSDQWVPLDIRQNIGQDLFPAENKNPTTFTFTEGVNEPYYYFKVLVTACYNNGGSQQMSEIEFLTKEQLDEQKQSYLNEYASLDLNAAVEPWREAEKAAFKEAYEKLQATNDVLEMSALNNTLAGLKSTLEASIADRAAQEERYANGGYLPLDGNTAWGNGENWTRLIDESYSTKWGGGRDQSGAFLIFTKASSMAPTFYTLITGNDTEGSPDRNWADWKIYGANFDNDAAATRDAEGWTLIDSKEGIGQDLLPGANYAPAYFSMSEKDAQEYRYFKIEITASYNGGGNIQMSEFTFGTETELKAIKAEYAEEFTPFLNGVFADEAMTLKYNAALRELTNAAPEEILAKVAAVKAVQQEILAAQPELAVVDGAYQIGTPGDLVTFANLMNAGGEGLLSSAVLTDDIDMTSIPYEYVKNLKNFTFNGQGHAIMNLSIDQSGTSEIGLFGQVEESSIINVRLVNAYVNGNNNAGGIVGRAINSIIKGNAVVDSYVEGRDHVGSVAGEVRGNTGCEFSDNYSNSEVESREYQAGGMIGTTLGAVIEHNLFIGNVTCGWTNGAGLVALVDGNESATIIRNNAVFASSVDAPNAYALVFTAGRDCTFENNYSLDKCLYNGSYYGLTNPNDGNGGQVDWATATSLAFYRDVVGFAMGDVWTLAYGGLYPTPSYITYDGPTKAQVPVTSIGYATFVAPADVDFSQAEGVEAFYVTDGGSKNKNLEPATLVRHGEAVVVKAQVEEGGETAETGVEVQDEVNLVLTNGDVKPGTQTVTIVCAELGFETSEKVSEIEFEGGYITLSKGEGTVVPTYYDNGSALRTYGSNVITFTGYEQAIAKVVLHCVSSGYTGTSWAVTAQDNTLELLNTGTKQIRIVSMDITFADEGITVPYTAQEIAEPYAANELKAATDFIDADGSQYVLAEKDGVVGFYQATEGSIINKGKGYLEVAAPAVKVFYLTTGDETGIAETMTNETLKADGAIYDLSGRRVEKLQKGIYIVNGKKVVNK